MGRTAMRESLAHVLTVGLGVWLFVGYTDAIFQLPWIRAAVLALTWLVVAGVAWATRGRVWRALPRGLVGLGVAWLAVILLSALGGWRPGYSLEQGLQGALLVFLAGVLLWLGQARPAWIEELGAGLLGMTLLLGSLAVAQWYGPWLGLLDHGWLPPSPWRLQIALWPHPNFLAAFLVWSGAYLLGRMTQAHGLEAWLWQGLGVLVAVLLVLTGSRGGWLAALTVLGVFLLTDGFRASRLAWRRPCRASCSSLRAGVGVLTLVGLAALLHWRWQTRALYEGLTQIGNVNSRDLIWRTAWDLLRAHPWTGIGLGNFGLGLAAQGHSPPFFLFRHAHNLWLHIGAEMGLPGLAVFTAFWAWWAWTMGRAWRRGHLTVRGRAAAAAVLGGLVHGLVDVWWSQPALWLTFVLLLALSVRDLPGVGAAASSARGWGWKAFWAGLLAIGVLLGVRVLPTYAWEGRGLQAAWAGQWARSAQAYQQAARYALWPAADDLAAAYAWAQAARQNPALASQAWPRAAAAYQRGLAAEPQYGPHWAAWALVQWRLGDRDAARVTMDAALERAPRAAMLWVLRGWMAEQEGQRTIAASMYRRALALEPPWRGQTFFRATAWRRDLVRATFTAAALPPLPGECAAARPRAEDFAIESWLCQAQRALAARRWDEAHEALVLSRFVATHRPPAYWALLGEWCRLARGDCACAWDAYRQAWHLGAQAPGESPLLPWAVWPTFYGRQGPGLDAWPVEPAGFSSWFVVTTTRAGVRACGLPPTRHP